jgi:type I restriction enzyme S subunit
MAFETKTIGDVCITNPETYKVSERWPFVNYLDTGNLTRGVIDSIQVISIGEKLPSRARRKVKAMDVLYSTVRPNQEHYGFVEEPLENMLVSTGFTVLRAKEGVNPKYVYYLLSQKHVTDLLHAVAENSTSAYPSLKPSDIEKMEFNFPEESIQNLVVKSLSDLDKKIELNRQINQTLEEMAQAIFKSWFVDFDPVKAKVQALENGGTENDANLAAMSVISGKSPQQLEAIQAEHPDQYKQLHKTASLFPSTMQDSELGEIPVGWEFVPFSEIAELNTKSIKPNKEPETIWEHYSIPAFDAGQQPSLDTGESIKSNKYIVKGSAILSSKLNPSTQRTWLPFIEKSDVAICSTEFMQFVPLIDDDRAFVYCTIRSQPFQHGILSRVTGTTGSRQRAQPKEVAVIQAINPSLEVKEVFNNQVTSWLDMIGNNQKQIKTLVELRDALLPKLLSGELQISTEDAV